MFVLGLEHIRFREGGSLSQHPIRCLFLGLGGGPCGKQEESAFGEHGRGLGVENSLPRHWLWLLELGMEVGTSELEASVPGS